MMEHNNVAVRKNFLVVDDQPEVRETLKMLLEIDGHIVTEASNGLEALDLFTPGRFDLVMTDYAMPEMRGDELATRIKELAPSQPILMVSGSINQPDTSSYSVDAILNKPFSLNELRQAIAQLVCPVSV
jgi:CheY-like chemotaxis protein